MQSKRGLEKIFGTALIVVFASIIILNAFLLMNKGGITGAAGGEGGEMGISELSNCTAACGGTIIASCQLNQSLANCSGVGINITADNIVLDCAGYTIEYGSGEGNYAYGVNVTGRVNVTIKNCIIQKNVSGGSNGHGINLDFSNNSLVYNNTLEVNGATNSRGIYLNKGIYNNISLNTILTSGTAGSAGIQADFASFNTIDSNNITTSSSGSSNDGIYFGYGLGYGTGSNNITNNIITTNGSSLPNHGIRIYYISDNIIVNNTISNCKGHGISLQSESDDNILINNTITNSSWSGVHADSAADSNNFSNTYSCFSNQSGGAYYDILDLDSNTFTSNTCDTNNGTTTCHNPCTAALACGDSISSSTTLTQNLTGCAGTGLNITASDVLFDCDGYSISGDYAGTGYGVNIINGLDNVTVRNCTIFGFDQSTEEAIHDSNGTNHAIIYNTLYNNFMGIYSIAKGRIEFNTAINSSFGIYATITGEGAFSGTINGNNISDNTLSGVMSPGIYMDTNELVNVTNNTIYSNRIGIRLGSLITTATKIWHNNIYSNTNKNIYDDNPPFEASYNGEGNYWGRSSCPVFIAGTDSNNANVVDNYAYNETDGWIAGDPADCCGLGGICGCGSTVSGSITLTADLSNSGTCFTVGADNITIDCDGHTITGAQSGSDYGISSSGYDNITIKNCNIENFSSDIYMTSSIGHTILNNNFSKDNGASEAGLKLSNINNSLIKDNRMFDNYRGIDLYYSDNNTIEDNTVYNNSNEGIFLDRSDNNTLKNNIVFNNSYSGMLISYSDDNNVTGGEIYNNNLGENGGAGGISLQYTVYSHVSGIYMHNNKRNGISGFYNDYPVIESNNIDSNCGGYAGISLSEDANATVKNNNVTNGTGYGIELWDTTATVSNNNVNYNSNYGIDVTSSASVDIENGEFIGNGNPSNGGGADHGIYASTGNPVNWTISQYTVCRDNDIHIDDGNITFNGGSLELDNCIINLEGAIINLTGNVTSLGKETRGVAANTSEDFDFSAEDSNITLYLSSGVTTTIVVSNSTPGSSPSGLNTLKGIDISVDSSTKGSLTWAFIKIFYDEAELSAANIDESSLKIYFYNTSVSAWQLEPVQGVNTAKNYVWANVTHLSLFGTFGTAPSSGSESGSSSQGCVNECSEGETVCRDGSMYICGNFDDDRCTEWGIKDCLPSETCEEGICVPMPCVEDWVCGEWSDCANEIQSRECSDWNKCGTITRMPAREKACVAEEKPPVKEEEVSEEMPEAETPAPVVERSAMSKIIAGLAIVLAIAAFLIIEYKTRIIKIEKKLVKSVERRTKKAKKRKKK